MKFKHRLLLPAAIIAIWLSTSALGQFVRSIEGHVVDVSDGDTITIMDADRSEWKVRLSGIDAPELGQAFGKRAKRELFELVMDRPVTVIFDRTDNGDRIVGIVKLESRREILVSVFPININQYLISQGFAWYDRSFEKEQTPDERKLYSKLEADARQGKRGLWAEKNPIPPWEYRGRSTSANSSAPTQSVSNRPSTIIGNKTSRLYYLSYCPDYDRIPDKYQVNFKTASEAQAAGYTLAKSCELK